MSRYLTSCIFLLSIGLACNGQSKEEKMINDHTKIVKDKKVNMPYCNEIELCNALKQVKVPDSVSFKDNDDGKEIYYPIQITFNVDSEGKVTFLEEQPKSVGSKEVITQIKNVLGNIQWKGVQKITRVVFRCELRNKEITRVVISSNDNYGQQLYCSK